LRTESRHFGSKLVSAGLLTKEKLDEAQLIQTETGQSLTRVLVDQEFVDETDLVKLLAEQIGIEYIALDEITIDPTASSLVPDNIAKRYAALPVMFDGDRLIVAMADPANVLAIDDIRTITGMEIITRVTTRSSVEAAIARMAAFDDSVSDFGDLIDEEEEDLSALKEALDEAPVVKLVNTIVSRAINEGASDIHIEPGEKDLRVRFRVDGVLHEVMSTPRSIANALVSRLKIMADINIAERRIPQDGRVSLKMNGKPVDLRVATLPSVFGEKVVLRILDRSSVLLELSDLGFLPNTLARFESAYTKPYGAILVTGPTGSGKSTTLYATLNVLNKPEVNIITTEDPVEYRLEGITQVQVNKKAGLTFATALRSILRSDPDIALVGEIRDQETAQIAIEAALTGHLVLSTLHTNDAPSSIGRLIEMGVEPYLVSSSLDAILGQRLARLLCKKCKVEMTPDAQVLKKARWTDEQIDSVSDHQVFEANAKGCSACSQGYRGRLALHEVMLMSDEIRRMSVENRPSQEIKEVAIEQGMLELWDDGMAKVRLGRTSLEEIMRVVA
jgi:type IV pilus assembly protein PilB